MSKKDSVIKERIIKKLDLLEKYQKLEQNLAKQDEKMDEFRAKLLEEDQISAIKQNLTQK